MEINKIYNCDCLDLMSRMPDNFVDLVITSPPYDNLRNYNGYEFDFKNIAKELYRVIKVGGVIVWVVGDATINGSETLTSFKQAIYFKEVCGFNAHDTMIYVKDARYPRNNAYSSAFEYMFIFTKGAISTFHPIKRETIHKGINKIQTCRQKDGSLVASQRYNSNDESTLYNVWYYSSGYMKSTKDIIAYEHPAIFPEQLAKDHIMSWSNKGDLIYDPFMGSGTVAKACIILERNYIGSEISKEYCELAEKRLEPYLLQEKLEIDG